MYSKFYVTTRRPTERATVDVLQKLPQGKESPRPITRLLIMMMIMEDGGGGDGINDGYADCFFKDADMFY